MLNVVSSLKGFELQAKDGSLGSVRDFLFDDSTWKVRWMVVDTGRWLSGRTVLIHPSAVVSADYGARELTVSLSTQQVKESPDILQDRPVSRQMQNDLYNYYGWDPAWGSALSGGGGMDGAGTSVIAAPLSAPIFFGASAVREAERGQIDLDEGDPHLRSIAEVTGYHVRAIGGTIGHIGDVLVETKTWDVRYLIVETSNWWIGQHVLISPHAVTAVNWTDHQITLDLTRDKVKSSPPWDPADMINTKFQRQLHSHYGWPGYGW